jgi:Bacterial transglutaminase-like cysteine proteinase BTLCP
MSLLQRVRDGVTRLLWHIHRPESPWERVTIQVPATVFGPGSRRHFAEYFQGESCVRVSSIDDIVQWLQTCEYVTDTEQFNERDRWQHPGTFELVRRGDCEDFALWAWRKLAELGIEAELYVGRIAWGEAGNRRQHAWIVYRIEGAEFLFEPAAGERQRMIRPLTEAMNEYVPHFAVNRDLGTSAFVGCILDVHSGSGGMGVSGLTSFDAARDDPELVAPRRCSGRP